MGNQMELATNLPIFFSQIPTCNQLFVRLFHSDNAWSLFGTVSVSTPLHHCPSQTLLTMDILFRFDSSRGFNIPYHQEFTLPCFSPPYSPLQISKNLSFNHVSTSSLPPQSNRSDVSKEVLVQHLIVKEDDLQLLQELEKRALGGEDLSDLAVGYSICPSKERGGMLGWVRKGQMVAEFEEAAFSAPINKVVKCKTKFGWHLLQVLSEREEPILEDISPSDLHTKLQDPSFSKEVQLIDVREPEEVDRASLCGFHVLPLGQLGTWGPEITTNFDPQKETYVLCHHGRRSLQVAKWLQTQGFRRVFNISGGIHEYAVKVDPSIPTY